MKKKVLSALYGTHLFGRERENLECYKALKALDFDVKVFGSYREPNGGEVGDELRGLGVFQGELPFGSHFSLKYFLKMRGYWHRQIYRVWKCSQVMRREEKRNQPNFIFIGGTMEFLYLWPWLIRTKVPIVYRVEDGPIWDSKFHLFVYKRLLSCSSLILACSQHIQRQCEILLPKRSHQNIVHLPNCAPAFSGRVEHELHKPEVKGLRLVYVGQITKQKGLPELIDAMIDLKGEPVELAIVGGSVYTSSMESHLQSISTRKGLAVTWAGRVDDPTPFYEWADIHIAPSVYEEPFGLVVVEAKRSGIPSIVFPSGGMKELVEHDVDGWICDDKTSSAIAYCVRQAINQRSELPMMGAAARLNFEKHYTFEKFVENWRNSLKKLNL
jgi:glycosyltransferase involved in cell wall biosynthesis